MRAENLYEFGFSVFKRTGASAGEVFREPGRIKDPEEERRHLVSMLAHDLKTPVVATLALLNRLRRGKQGSLTEGQAGYVNTIYKQIQRVEKLIDKFLDFACVDLYFITPETTAIQAEDECREILVLLQPLAEAKGIELRVEFPEEILVLQADSLLFRRALENLLVNAIKYSPPQSLVILGVQGVGPEVQFSIRDQGPGIPPQDLPHLFEVFYRGAASCAEKGFGLGLATVKQIIEAHGGRLWVETAIGQGTTFSFTLPR
jgi:signal transduction histidine kinase